MVLLLLKRCKIGTLIVSEKVIKNDNWNPICNKYIGFTINNSIRMEHKSSTGETFTLHNESNRSVITIKLALMIDGAPPAKRQ